MHKTKTKTTELTNVNPRLLPDMEMVSAYINRLMLQLWEHRWTKVTTEMKLKSVLKMCKNERCVCNTPCLQQGHPIIGQGQKLVNVDVIWKCLSQVLCKYDHQTIYRPTDRQCYSLKAEIQTSRRTYLKLHVHQPTIATFVWGGKGQKYCLKPYNDCHYFLSLQNHTNVWSITALHRMNNCLFIIVYFIIMMECIVFGDISSDCLIVFKLILKR